MDNSYFNIKKIKLKRHQIALFFIKLLSFFFLLFVGFPNNLFAQNQLSGKVTNAQDHPLPFVNILINDSQKDGVSSDIDGQFLIDYKNPIKQLTFSYLGYENLILKAPFSENLTVKLTATSYAFEEVTVIAGENPAHRIIRKVVENRPLNDPEKMERYSCLTYNKMALGYDLKTEEMKAHYLEKDTSKKINKRLYNNYSNLHNTFAQHDLMLVESVSKRRFKKPHDVQEEVILNRVSGTEKLPIIAIANQAQSFSFYQEEVVIFDQPFLNPISKNSTKKYFFQLTDTLFQQNDTIYIIAFQPKKGKNFNGLEGVLYINTNQYAIQNVIAKPNKEDHLTHFEITQKYKWINQEHWFPEQLLFEMSTQPMGISFAGIKMYGRTYVSEVDFDPIISKKTFQQGEEVILQKEAYTRQDSLWKLYRKEDLTAKEEKTYQVIDSVFEAKNLDRWISILEFIGQERFKLGPVDLNLGKLINGNPAEGFRLGVGLATNETVSKHIEIGGYGVYGFKDKKWKYGGHFGILFDEYRENRLDFVYKNDVHVPAEPKFIQRGDFLNFGQLADIRDKIIYKGIHFQTFPIKYLRFNARFSQQTLSPRYEYTFTGMENNPAFNFTEMQVGIRYAYNEKFVRFFGRRVNNQSNFPILELQYTKGFDNLLNGNWTFRKYLLSIDHTFRRKALGKTAYRLEAGLINNPLPYFKNFSSFGLGTGYRSASLGISQGFQTMEFYEFLSDRFVHLFFRHDFGSLLLKSKRFKPNIIIEHNVAFGSLQQPENHQNIAFKTMEKGFFEAGLILENLIRAKYLNVAYVGLGAGMYYRYGPYQNAAFGDNVAWGLKISVSY